MARSSSRRGRRPVEGLTDSQRKILKTIGDYVARHGFPPTAQELGQALGIAAASAHELVSQLVRKGYLQREPHKARGLTVIRQPCEEPTELVPLPLLGAIAAGRPLLAEENILGEVLVDRATVRTARCFALRVSGDSMSGASIRDGDVLVVRQQPVAENGDIVVAMLDDEATVKRLVFCEEHVELRPENPKYRPIPIDPDANFRILGKVIAVRRPAER